MSKLAKKLDNFKRAVEKIMLSTPFYATMHAISGGLIVVMIVAIVVALNKRP